MSSLRAGSDRIRVRRSDGAGTYVRSHSLRRWYRFSRRLRVRAASELRYTCWGTKERETGGHDGGSVSGLGGPTA